MNGVNDYVERMVKRSVPNQVVLAKVESVDAEGYACEVSMEGKPNRLKVRIRSVIDGSQEGMLILPKVGSFVLVGLINNNPNSNYIVSFSEVDDIWLQSPTIKLNGDSNGGVVNWPKAVEQLEKLTARVDALYDALNTAAPSAPTDSGASLIAAIKGSLAAVVDIEKWDGLENENVTHG